MNEDEDDRDLRGECRKARMQVHARADGDLPAEEARLLERHLDACADCREFASGVEALSAAFAALPETPLPGDALAAVFAATVEAEPRWRRWLAIAPAARPVLAGAAAVVVAGVALWFALSGGSDVRTPASPADAEVARATAEARYALTLASSAMRRTGRAVIDDVLREEVAPALDRVPMRWPGAPAARRNGA